MSEWRWIPGHEGAYQVSTDGAVRSVDRQSIAGARLTGRLIGIFPEKSGHLKVSLRRDGRQKSYYVHQLVLAAFLGPRPGALEVCHNNGDPADNRLENLRYDTHSSNMRDRAAHGTDSNLCKTHCPDGHPYDDENTYYSRGGRRRHCRTCQRDQHKEARDRDPERDRARKRAAYWRDPEKHRARCRADYRRRTGQEAC